MFDDGFQREMKTRMQAAVALHRLHAARGSGFRNSFLTIRGWVRIALSVMVTACFLLYVFPHLPGTEFVGNLHDAVWSASMIVLMSLVTIPLNGLLTERMLSSVAFGRRMAGGLRVFAFFAFLMIGMPLIEAWFMTLPGNLTIVGFWGWAWSGFAVLVCAWVISKIWDFTKRALGMRG